jgi:hypothetical protein
MLDMTQTTVSLVFYIAAPKSLIRPFVDSNINIQMNYWLAEMTNLDVTQSLFEYFLVRSSVQVHALSL